MSIKKNTYVRERKRESKEREGMKDRKKRVEREERGREWKERKKEIEGNSSQKHNCFADYGLILLISIA